MGYGGKAVTAYLADIRRPMGNPSTTIWSDSAVLQMLNDAYIIDVCCAFDLPDLIRVSGSSTLASAAVRMSFDALAALKIITVVRTSDYMALEHSSRMDMDMIQIESTTVTGAPEKWCDAYGEDDTVQPYVFIWPRADAAYSLIATYKIRPTALSGATDVTILTNEWDDVITDFARSRLAHDMNRANDSKFYLDQARQKAMVLAPNSIQASDTVYQRDGHGLLRK
jgi:hypothetical protein